MRVMKEQLFVTYVQTGDLFSTIVVFCHYLLNDRNYIQPIELASNLYQAISK